VKKRTQLKNPLTKTSTKRNKKTGAFIAVKKSAKKFKGVRKEKGGCPRFRNHPCPPSLQHPRVGGVSRKGAPFRRAE